MSEFLLGSTVSDVVTGFTGIATGKASYMTGCDQYLVQPECKDGAFVEGRWFDFQRLLLLPAIAPIELNNEKPGACGMAPIK